MKVIFYHYSGEKPPISAEIDSKPVSIKEGLKAIPYSDEVIYCSDTKYVSGPEAIKEIKYATGQYSNLY